LFADIVVKEENATGDNKVELEGGDNEEEFEEELELEKGDNKDEFEEFEEEYVLGKDCTDCILTRSVTGVLTRVVSGVGFLGARVVSGVGFLGDGGGIASCDNVRTRVMLFLLVVLLLP